MTLPFNWVAEFSNTYTQTHRCCAYRLKGKRRNESLSNRGSGEGSDLSGKRIPMPTTWVQMSDHIQVIPNCHVRWAHRQSSKLVPSAHNRRFRCSPRGMRTCADLFIFALTIHSKVLSPRTQQTPISNKAAVTDRRGLLY